MEESEDIIVEYCLDNLGRKNRNGYVAHAYCYAGECAVTFNGTEFHLSPGKCMVIVDNRFVDSVIGSSDFNVVCVYIAYTYSRPMRHPEQFSVS